MSGIYKRIPNFSRYEVNMRGEVRVRVGEGVPPKVLQRPSNGRHHLTRDDGEKRFIDFRKLTRMAWQGINERGEKQAAREPRPEVELEGFEWVPGYRGRYQANRDGMVISCITGAPKIMRGSAGGEKNVSRIYTLTDAAGKVRALAASTIVELTFKGREIKQGMRHGGGSRAILTEELVKGARRDYEAAGRPQGMIKELAERHGVDASTMGDALSGRTWGHLDPEAPRNIGELMRAWEEAQRAAELAYRRMTSAVEEVEGGVGVIEAMLRTEEGAARPIQLQICAIGRHNVDLSLVGFRSRLGLYRPDYKRPPLDPDGVTLSLPDGPCSTIEFNWFELKNAFEAVLAEEVTP